MEKQNEVVEIDVIRLLKAMWRKIWIIVLIGVLCAALAFSCATFLITPTYQSSALLYVNSGTLNVGEMKMTVSDLSVSSNLVDYYIIILKTRATLEDVIREADLSYSYEDLSDMISASAVNETGIFRITVTSTNPYEAEKIARTITYVLPEKIEGIMEGTSARTVDFAVVPSKKSAPSITRYTAVGLVIGVVIAAAIIVITELMDDVIHGGDTLSESFTVPILAEIPELLDEKTLSKYGKYGQYRKYGSYRYGYSGKYERQGKYGRYESYGSYADSSSGGAKEG